MTHPIRGRSTRALGAAVLLAALLAATGSAQTPIQSTGALGALHLSSGQLRFNTDSGKYTVNGVAPPQTPRWAVLPARSGDVLLPERAIPVYDFSSVQLGSGV